MARPDKPDWSVASQTPARALHALSSFPLLADRRRSLDLPRPATIERANALQPVRRLEYFPMTESLHGVAVSSEPVLFHRPPGELVVLGAPLIFFRAIDQVNDVA